MKLVQNIFLLVCYIGALDVGLCVEDTLNLNKTPRDASQTDPNGTYINQNETSLNQTDGSILDTTSTGADLEIVPVDLAHILIDDEYGSDPFRFNKSSLDATIGTHVIAPCMYNKDSFCAQNIPLKSLVAPAVVLDMRGVVWGNSTARIYDTDVEEWESINGEIPNGSIVLFQTGWSRFWLNTTAYRGSDSADSDQFVFPDIDISVATWLVTNRTISGVGIDAFSLERGGASGVHQVLADKNLFVVENLDKLDYLDPFGTSLVVTPLKVQGAGAAPCGVLGMRKGEPVARPAPTVPPTEPPTEAPITVVPNENSDSNVIPDKGHANKDDPIHQSSKDPNSGLQNQPFKVVIALICILAVFRIVGM